MTIQIETAPVEIDIVKPIPYRGVAGVPGEGMYCILTFGLEHGVVRDIHFRTPGCPSSMRAAEALCRLAEGRALDKIRLLTGEELLRLAPMPEGKEDACFRAVAALAAAKEMEDES